MDMDWLRLLSNWTQPLQALTQEGADHLSTSASACWWWQSFYQWLHSDPDSRVQRIDHVNVSALLQSVFGAAGQEGECLWDWFDFTEFQVNLLGELSSILLINTVLLLIAWNYYGPQISSRFSDGASKTSSQAIEELRNRMSELKLPQEHDFKLK